MRSLAFSLAVLIVLAAPIAALGLASSAGRWARWLVRMGGALGIVGLVLTAAFVVNLVVPRSCSTASSPGATVHEVNRPFVSIAIGDGDCFRSAVAQAQGAVLAGVATSALVALADRRRRGREIRPSAPAGAGASPAARHP